eukprot:2741649-Pyramimonas_sp.AAC.1
MALLSVGLNRTPIDLDNASPDESTACPSHIIWYSLGVRSDHDSKTHPAVVTSPPPHDAQKGEHQRRASVSV